MSYLSISVEVYCISNNAYFYDFSYYNNADACFLELKFLILISWRD